MEQVDERPPSSAPPLTSAIQTPFLEKHFISNQHSIATTACSHNTPSNLHQSFCRGKLDKLRETAQSVITDRKKRGFCFHAFVFNACSASSIMAGWWEVEGGEGRISCTRFLQWEAQGALDLLVTSLSCLHVSGRPRDGEKKSGRKRRE